MSKKVSKTAIGAFVVGAIALMVALIVVAGSGKFFTKAIPCVFYFSGSVQGLNVGSPIKFKGVQIGEVTDIKMTLDQNTMDVEIPVYANIYPEKFILKKGQKYRDNLGPAIDAGLRAQLMMQSLITGQLYISLDLYPDAGAPEFHGDGALPEIPTVPTVIEQLGAMIKEINFKEIVETLDRTANGIEKLVNDPDLEAGIDNFNDTLQELELLVRNVNNQVEPVSGELQKTLAGVQDALEQMEKTLANSAKMTADGSPVMHELLKTINELSEASRSMGNLAEYLERHPESVIFGKGGSQ